jgi:hypothetical protein
MGEETDTRPKTFKITLDFKLDKGAPLEGLTCFMCYNKVRECDYTWTLPACVTNDGTITRGVHYDCIQRYLKWDEKGTK